ncbi:MAG: TetR/AcrR family transcriptional regulator [Flavobacteriales bacterium]
MNKPNRKEQIKSCAARLFRKRGFTATSVRDIAAELNIEAPSLYNHIKGKQELLQLLLLELAGEFTTGMETVYGSNLAAKEKLERLIKLHVDLTISHTDGMALLTSDWVHLEEPAYSTFVSQRDAYEVAFREILKEALHTDKNDKVDLDLALFSMLSTLRWLYSWYLKNQKVNQIELEKEMVRNLLTGLFQE